MSDLQSNRIKSDQRQKPSRARRILNIATTEILVMYMSTVEHRFVCE